MAIAWIRFESLESFEILNTGRIHGLNLPVRRPTARKMLSFHIYDHCSAHFLSLFYGEWDLSLVLRHRLLWAFEMKWRVPPQRMRLSWKTKKWLRNLNVLSYCIIGILVLRPTTTRLYTKSWAIAKPSRYDFRAKESARRAKPKPLMSWRRRPTIRILDWKPVKYQKNRSKAISVNYWSYQCDWSDKYQGLSVYLFHFRISLRQVLALVWVRWPRKGAPSWWRIPR